jgi:hypothetical protein
MAAMVAMPAAIILSAMAAMLNEGLFLPLTIPSKIKQCTCKLDERVRDYADKRGIGTVCGGPLSRWILNHRGLISHVNGSILMMFLRW